jgi:hypothetical protein
LDSWLRTPLGGEWVALPVLRGAGGDGLDGRLAEQIMYPTAERLLEHCDAVLRLPGESTGADQDVAIAQRRGLPVFTRVEDIPATRRRSRDRPHPLARLRSSPS